MSSELGGVTGTSEGCAALQKDFSRLDKWAEKNCLKFSKGNCRVLLPGKNNPRHQYRLGDDMLKSSSVEDLSILVDNKLSVSQGCALVVIKTSGCRGDSECVDPLMSKVIDEEIDLEEFKVYP
ncbi:rna-directed dna polymerase from mobile element jockey-like [Willisornis vidua]|uniref:Rna-directed dna polymerase from mobile element jockey-like n=1 Tax=Willisornis vidua TaxID=1566151 RepID=A0ABQ9CXU4_9PASS|nr:rna-directed dna polymerase from mobile element jockey-like [Willisornis vidua]